MSRDHEIELSRDFVGRAPSSYITILLGLVFTGLVELEIMTLVVSVPVPI